MLLLGWGCSSVFWGQGVLPTPQQMEAEAPGLYCQLQHFETVYLETGNSVVREMLYNEIFRDISLEEAVSPETASIALVRDEGIVPEGYTLEVQSGKIRIGAADDSGFLYAVQTLRQLLQEGAAAERRLPCVRIKDAPKVAYRSLLLDSGRQYQRVETLKKYIDLLCMLKMNYLHWHLTEGLGWRVQIRRYPLLTNIGAFVGTGKEQQGFYTQEEIAGLVRYAKDRGVTIVPEIDIPGHASAALSAYPSLGCFQEPIVIPQRGFTPQIFCAGKQSTLVFLKGVLDEVCRMFPSEYIHIGGDEAPKGNWNRCPDCQRRIHDLQLQDAHQLQLWLTAEMARHLKKKGRKAVCWGDVVYHDGYELPDNIVVQWWNWRGHKDRAVQAARQRRLPVICSPNYYTYLNFHLSPWRGYGENRTFDLYDAYQSNPATKELGRPDVLGMCAALWTDDELVEEMLDERLFPRILALSEQMWHRGEPLSFRNFYQQVQDKETWFLQKGYRYGPALREGRSLSKLLGGEDF